MSLVSTRLAIVDDQILLRKVLADHLSAQKNFQVIIQASDVVTLLKRLQHDPADILVLEIQLPELDILDALKLIRYEYPALKILTLSMCTDLNLISNLLDLGIYGCVSKADEPSELLSALQSIAENRIFRNKLFTEALYWNRQVTVANAGEEPSVPLNDREIRILKLLWEERSNKEIAAELYLSVRSVEKIRQDIKEKLYVKSTVGLMKYAIRKKIIGANAD